MISSNLSRAGHPSRLLVKQSTPEGQAMGLHSDSVIVTDNLATVRENETDRAIGTCTVMQLVDSALRTSLGL